MKMWILNLLGVIGEFLKPIFQKGIADQLNIILPMALSVVSMISIDPTIMTNEQKRQSAFDALKKDLIAKEITAATSTINLAIEMAYQKVKK